MTKEEMWQLLEIKELLADTDHMKNDEGLTLLVELIESNFKEGK